MFLFILVVIVATWQSPGPENAVVSGESQSVIRVYFEYVTDPSIYHYTVSKQITNIRGTLIYRENRTNLRLTDYYSVVITGNKTIDLQITAVDQGVAGTYLFLGYENGLLRKKAIELTWLGKCSNVIHARFDYKVRT